MISVEERCPHHGDRSRTLDILHNRLLESKTSLLKLEQICAASDNGITYNKHQKTTKAYAEKQLANTERGSIKLTKETPESLSMNDAAVETLRSFNNRSSI